MPVIRTYFATPKGALSSNIHYLRHEGYMNFDTLVGHITFTINCLINQSLFPSLLKMSRVIRP